MARDGRGIGLADGDDVSAIFVLPFKMALVASIVLLAARVAERTRPAFGALVATLPLSLGPSYVLVALEHDAPFLADAALNGIASAGATVVFIAAFALLIVRVSLAYTLIGAFSAWALAAWPTYAADWSAAGATCFSVAILAIARIATADLRAYRPAGAAQRRWWDVPVRAASVATLVGLIAGLSHLLGPAGVGTLANFPVIMSSVGVIMRLRYGPQAAAAILANSVDGMAGVVLAMLALRLTMIPLGATAALLLGLAICVGWNAVLFALNRASSEKRTNRSSTA